MLYVDMYEILYILCTFMFIRKCMYYVVCRFVELLMYVLIDETYELQMRLVCLVGLNQISVKAYEDGGQR